MRFKSESLLFAFAYAIGGATQHLPLNQDSHWWTPVVGAGIYLLLFGWKRSAKKTTVKYDNIYAV